MAIAVAIASAAAVTVILGYVIPEDSPFGFGSLFWRSYFGILAGTAIVFTLKTRLHIVDGSPERVLAELTRRLRVSGYLVTEKRWHILVQISSTSAIRIYARPNPAGTLVLYRMEAASSGWVIVFILLLMRVTAPVAMAIALFMHYRTAVFASERVLPRLTAMPRLDGPPPKEAARTMLIDCLSEGRRLAKEAYDAARSNYEDSVLLLVLAALSGSAFLALYCNVFLLEDLEARTRLTATLLIGVVLGTVMSVGLWRVLARRSLPRMQELEAWSWRLNGALAREVAAGPPEDDEPSSFELIAESYEEMPKWLRARRKGGMSREPFQWLLIVFFLMYGVSLGFSGIMELLRADYQAATPILGIAAAFGGAAIAIYWHWKRTREEEDEKTKTSMANRLETLKTEMEAYLRSV